MKLKKIASLALAGIMAVSMLAGCKDGGNSNSGSSSSENTGTASGYSAMLGQKAADELVKAGKDDIFTFADNNADQKALADAVQWVDDTSMETWIKSNTVDKLTSATTVLTAFHDNAKLDRAASNVSLTTNGLATGKFFNAATWPANTQKVGEIWVANSAVNLDAVLKTIFDRYEDAFTGADSNYSASSTTKYDYHYTVSVSVVNKPVTYNTQFNGSVNFVAVTITRTSTVA